jgi:hypothetical protein
MQHSVPTQRPPKRRVAAIRSSLGLLVLSSLLSLSCSRQAEGERCDTRNGNLDCESGLVCVSAAKLNSIEVGGVCCRSGGERGTEVCLGSTGLEDGGTFGDDEGPSSNGSDDAASPANPLGDADAPLGLDVDASDDDAGN